MYFFYVLTELCYNQPMLEAKYIIENPELVAQKTASRGIQLDLTEFIALSSEHKAILQRVEHLRAELNRTSKQIGEMKKQGQDASIIIVEMKAVSDSIKVEEEKLRQTDETLRSILLNIPNLPHDSVPKGLSEKDNQEIRTYGQKPEFDFTPRPHWEIGSDLGILDFERASKIAGARFTVYLGAGALLERALINFMLDTHTRERGYKEVIPPFIANETSLTGTGNLPKFEADLFKLRGYPWYMIPTAEVPLTNFYRDEILDASLLPQRFVAYTPCFRSEAGSYGKDIRGLVRQHQFNKVEMMSFVLPENSYQELEFMTGNAETILQRLGLHYRVVALSTGDLGFAGAKTYDLEIWMPNRNAFLEISSCSNCESFQARRSNIRFRRESKSRLEFVHTLNGSGVAVGRTVSAILECFQQADGSVLVPEVLHGYMNGLESIQKS